MLEAVLPSEGFGVLGVEMGGAYFAGLGHAIFYCFAYICTYLCAHKSQVPTSGYAYGLLMI